MLSLQELRIQDYQQGRKTAGTFGQSASFGTAPAAGIFGQPAQPTVTQPTPSMFGGGGGAFGTTNQPVAGGGAFGTFGQTPANQPPQQGTGLFGNNFGQPQQPQPNPTGFGGFGAQQPAPSAGTNLFSGGAFGSHKPAFGTGTFGGGGAATFGQPQQTGGLFGTQNQQGAGGFGGTFGKLILYKCCALPNPFNPEGPKPSIFGQPAAQPTQQFGTFGGAPQGQQPQGQQQGGLFGGGSGLFGQNTQQQQSQQQPAPGGRACFITVEIIHHS